MTRLQTSTIQKRRVDLRTHLPGSFNTLAGKAGVHYPDHGILWTSKHRVSPLSSYASIVLTKEGITRKIIQDGRYFVANNRPIWRPRTIWLKAHLPIACI